MRGECVLDASVAGAIFFQEEATDRARALADEGGAFIAPDLLLIEMASIASKKVRRNEIPRAYGELAVREVNGLVVALIPSDGLAVRAFDLAATHGFSAYDSLYLALAEARRTYVVTADIRLDRKAREVGLGSLVRLV